MRDTARCPPADGSSMNGRAESGAAESQTANRMKYMPLCEVCVW